jgi:hypothetical protein
MAEVYLAVMNSSGVSQNFSLFAFFDDNDKRLISASVLASSTEYITSTSTEGNYWKSIDLSSFTQQEYDELIDDKEVDVKDKKDSIFGNDYVFDGTAIMTADASTTSYYRMEIYFPEGNNGEFFLEGIGEEGAYAHLDPMYESWTTTSGVESWYEPYDPFFSWTATTAGYTITSIKLKGYRAAGQDPGTMTLYVHACDDSHHPTGDSLCSGTYALGTLLENPTEAVFEIDLGAGAVLTGGTEYCGWGQAPSSDVTKFYRLSIYGTSTYSGYYGYTGDNGSTWNDLNRDVYFEIWGEALTTAEEAQEVQIISAD